MKSRLLVVRARTLSLELASVPLLASSEVCLAIRMSVAPQTVHLVS